MSQITLYTKDGTEMMKAPVLIQEASWFEGGEGRLMFRLPISDTMVKHDTLKWGTKVSAEIEGFSETWIGFIEPPRRWGNGGVIVNCKSMEYMFHYRKARNAIGGSVTPPVVVEGTAGSIVQQILNIANTEKDTGITVGAVYTGGLNRQETLNDMLDVHLSNLAERTDSVWSVTGQNDRGKLTAKLNFLPRQSRTVDYLIEEGINLETPEGDAYVIEDGDVFNDVLGLGDSTIEASTVGYEVLDVTSIEEFGLRSTIQTFMGDTQLATVRRNAETYLAAHLGVGVILNPELPYTPEIASRLSIGCVLPVRLHSVGFGPDGTVGVEGYARVVGITFKGLDNRISLVVSSV